MNRDFNSKNKFINGQKKSDIKITVFTPTYNREYLIMNLYNSLKRQKRKNFEWLVIDDGSTDGTKEAFQKIQEEKSFPVRYYWFDNVGKQREINKALELAKGELFFTVDSDDILTEDALEKIENWEKTIPLNEKFCGLAGSDGNINGKVINPVFEGEYIDATFFNRYAESGLFIGHDRPWVFYTDVHKKFKYPEFEGEKFITEAVAWNRMAAAGYKIRCFNEVIYLREQHEDGLTAGITNTLINNPKGFGVWRKELMDFLDYSFSMKLRNYFSFYLDVHEKCSLKEMAEYIGAPLWCMHIAKMYYGLKKWSDKK